MANQNTHSFTLSSTSDTDRLGELIAKGIPEGTTIGFTGTLGSGKTRLIQAIAVANGIEAANVTSPTYVLCHIYHGDRIIYHLDVYRLRDTDEFWELGVEEMFESSALTLIEWADRVDGVLPASRLNIDLQITGPDERVATIQVSDEYLSHLSVLHASWEAASS